MVTNPSFINSSILVTTHKRLINMKIDLGIVYGRSIDVSLGKASKSNLR
jgi:hypothetical protein